MSDARSSFYRGVRDLLPLMPAGISFGFVAGAAIAQVGLGLAESLGMSLGTYGASAQLAATVLWGEGAPLAVAVLTALVINARFFVYSASFAPVLEHTPGWLRAVSAYLMRDGAYALAMARREEIGDRDLVAYYLGASLVDWVVWIAATAAGTLGAAFVPASWQLDFIVPLVFVALLAEAARTRLARESAVVAAAGAAVFVPLLPMQTGIIASIVSGMAWGAMRSGRESRGEVGVE